MIIYGVGFPLTEDAVECAKACAPDLHVVGDGLFIMGSWEDHFPVYDIVLMRPNVIAVHRIEGEVGHAAAQ
jgi:hypothetical protein